MAQSVLQTADRALMLLELLAQYPEGLLSREIEERMQLNSLTVHRLISTLEGRKFIERTADRRYTIGIKLVEISSLKLNSLELKTEARPYLNRLAQQTMQPVQMAIMSGDKAMFIEKIEPMNSIRMYSQIGKTIPLHCSAVGKVLLFDMPEKEALKRLKNGDFDKFTENTLESPQDVLDDIEKYRPYGFALDNAEHERDIYCIAAPIRDYTGRIIAAVSTAGKHCGFVNDPDDPFARATIATAGEISRCMGYSG